MVPAFWGLISQGPQSEGDGSRGHNVGGLFYIFDSAGCPFLKQEEEEQGEEGGDGAAGDPKKEKKSLDSDDSEDEDDDYQVLSLAGAWYLAFNSANIYQVHVDYQYQR